MWQEQEVLCFNLPVHTPGVTALRILVPLRHHDVPLLQCNAPFLPFFWAGVGQTCRACAVPGAHCPQKESDDYCQQRDREGITVHANTRPGDRHHRPPLSSLAKPHQRVYPASQHANKQPPHRNGTHRHAQHSPKPTRTLDSRRAGPVAFFLS